MLPQAARSRRTPRHQREIDHHADDPQELARLLVRAVESPRKYAGTRDEESRGAGRMQVTDERPPLTSRMMYRRCGRLRRTLAVDDPSACRHRQENADHELHDQHDDASEPKKYRCEVLRRLIVEELALVEPAHGRRASIQPPAAPSAGTGGNAFQRHLRGLPSHPSHRDRRRASTQSE